MATKMLRPTHYEPNYSVDLFDEDKQDKFGEPYCVAKRILYAQVDEYWDNYKEKLCIVCERVLPLERRNRKETCCCDACEKEESRFRALERKADEALDEEYR